MYHREAHTLAKLARTLKLPGEAKVHEKATDPWLAQALCKGQLIDASCHGMFDVDDFLSSALRLARGGRLTLAETLNRVVDLRGLRLLILSAYRTAILNLWGARTEVRSLTAGMIHAGAQAVLASLWSVDDKATYLLMVRFMQEPPAAALARVQRWLRTAPYRELQQWRATTLPEVTAEERQQAGSVTPLHDPWEAEKDAPISTAKPVAVRGRGDRYDIGEAEVPICRPDLLGGISDHGMVIADDKFSPHLAEHPRSS